MNISKEETKKLYWEDPYLSEFNAEVLSCEPYRDGFAVTLNRSAFFPEGGGQTGDSGEIGGIKVYDTKEKDGTILHLTKEPVPLGSSKCKIDFDLRFSRMQCHSGEHVLSGIMYSLFGIENRGFHLSDSVVTIDTSRPLTDEEADIAEEKANEAIWKNIKINAYFPKKEELASLYYRSKLDITDNVRIVDIAGIDTCACCAPHLSSTGEIGMIKIAAKEKYKVGSRLYILCGTRALKDYRKRLTEEKKISNLLSAKQDALFPAVENLFLAEKKEKEKSSRLRRQLKEQIFLSLKKTDSPITLFLSEEQKGDAREYATDLLNLSPTALVFAGEEESYAYAVASSKTDLKAITKEINSIIRARGGGSSTLISGTSNAKKEDIEKLCLLLSE